jgi:rubredoxin
VAVHTWKRCPTCGSRELVEMLYGDPGDPELRDLWAEGKAMLRPRRSTGGRCVPPGWGCRECGFESRPVETTE